MWTELRVPIGHESDKQRWVEYFQPLVHATGHKQSIWARLRFNPEKVILGTRKSDPSEAIHHSIPRVNLLTRLLYLDWSNSLACRDFESSPAAQLFREQLASDGITFLTCHEFPRDPQCWFDSLPRRRHFIHIFWVYFKVPVTKEQKRRVAKSVGIRPPVVLNVLPHQRRQPRLPVILWATRTEYLHGEEVQLLLWPHIWRDEEAALYRHITYNRETNLERFQSFLRDIGSMEFKEDYCHFEELPRL